VLFFEIIKQKFLEALDRCVHRLHVTGTLCTHVTFGLFTLLTSLRNDKLSATKVLCWRANFSGTQLS